LITALVKTETLRDKKLLTYCYIGYCTSKPEKESPMIEAGCLRTGQRDGKAALLPLGVT